MKLHRYYILSIIVVMLTAISFDTSLPMLDNTAEETKIEVSFEEKESKKISDEKLITYVPELHLQETKTFTGFDLSIPLVNQLYLNNIFKPPKFS